MDGPSITNTTVQGPLPRMENICTKAKLRDNLKIVSRWKISSCTASL